MTLIAGFRCTDGFVIAADTEMTLTNISVQGHKLLKSRLDDALTFCIGFAGTESLGLMASQSIRDVIRGLVTPTLADIKVVVSELLRDIYEKHVLLDWTSIDVSAPSVWLIIGVQDANKEFGVLSTDLNMIHEVDHSSFAGWGHEAAAYFCEKLFNDVPLPTAVTEHLVRQVFREVKGRGLHVGGNTEIFSRRCTPTAEPFFDVGSLRDYRPLWGLQDILLSAVQVAMNRQRSALPGQELPQPLLIRLDKIRKTLASLYAESHKATIVAGEERHLTEFDTEYGHPFRDY